MKAPIIPEINLKNINEKTINLDYVFNSSKIKVYIVNNIFTQYKLDR